MNRYTRNHPAISIEEQELLKNKTAAVIGCGGLGGHIIDALARIGIGTLILIDVDSFSESNLNRQLLCTEAGIGKKKAEEAAKHVAEINSSVKTNSICTMLTEENAKELLCSADIVLDALDNVEGRLAAEHACEDLGIYFIHGAIGGWNAQVSTIAPGSRTLEKIYPSELKIAPPSVLSFVPDFAASIEVSEAIKVLLNKADTLEGKLLIADLKNNMFTTVEL